MEPLTVSGTTLESLGAIAQYVMAAAVAAGLSKKSSYKLRLAVDEIATNIINYGYNEAGLEGVINLHAEVDPKALTISLEDTAIPYDPTKRELPEAEDFSDIPLADRPVGGWGVYLAFEGVDEFLYERVDNRNRNIFVIHRNLNESN
ncbi:MAG: ATP-binding protein [Leptolyngbyaceae bacterium]|nr:ATP-binding protein [Leptolyngbyaceae bacterium]